MEGGECYTIRFETTEVAIPKNGGVGGDMVEKPDG
jgi:hypothetical protein